MNSTLLSGLLALGVITTSMQAAQNWGQYRGPHGDGISPETISGSWSDSGPKRLWRAETQTGFSSFAVADGRVFTLVARNIDGTLSEACLALDSTTGKELWIAPIRSGQIPRRR